MVKERPILLNLSLLLIRLSCCQHLGLNGSCTSHHILISILGHPPVDTYADKMAQTLRQGICSILFRVKLETLLDFCEWITEGTFQTIW
jgi:hypothetical protein